MKPIASISAALELDAMRQKASINERRRESER